MHHARIIAPDVCCAGKAPEVCRSRLLRRSEARHIAQVGRDAGCQILRHRGVGNGHCLVRTTRHRHRESAGAPRCTILLFNQRGQQSLGPAPIARDGKTHRIAARDLVIPAPAQCNLIPALCAAIVTDEIVGQRPIRSHGKGIATGSLCLVKGADGLNGIFRDKLGLAKQGLGSGIARLDLVSPGKEPDRGIAVTQLQRGACRIE